ncbi:hypothetical protein BH10PLA2_BH10PLA2_19980 [soil metagenome]
MQMTLHTPETMYSPRHLPSWFLLAAAAGMVNGFAFLTCQQYVSHVTGTITRMGLEWPHVGIAAEYTAVLLSFMLGAVAAVLIIRTGVRRRGRLRWATPLVSVALILSVVAVAGEIKEFGPFGDKVASDPPPALLLALLSFGMGIQNASVALSTGLAVRTTHMTGPTTDVGIHLATALLVKGKERWEALRGAGLRGGKIVAFMVGAGLSVPLASAFGYLALLTPALLILSAAALSFVPAWSWTDFPFGADDKNNLPDQSKGQGTEH